MNCKKTVYEDLVKQELEERIVDLEEQLAKAKRHGEWMEDMWSDMHYQMSAIARPEMIAFKYLGYMISLLPSRQEEKLETWRTKAFARWKESQIPPEGGEVMYVEIPGWMPGWVNKTPLYDLYQEALWWLLTAIITAIPAVAIWALLA